MGLRASRRWARRALGLGLFGGLSSMFACGSRSGLDMPPLPPPPPECLVDADCPGAEDLCNPVVCEPIAQGEGGAGGAGGAPVQGGVCKQMPPVDCDDNDVCTSEVCEPTTGECVYAIATLDSDGDGHRAPRPGTIPGAPDACGDDCDDSSPLAHPGGTEVCDGVDNDCNGVIDDNATFIPLNDQPIRISGEIAPAGTGGLAFDGASYAAVYTGSTQGFNVYLSMLTPQGNKIVPPGESMVTLVNADAGGGPVVWVGDRYGLAWQDRRSSDYEIYFTLLDAKGTKGIADTRLTFELGFSLNPTMAWNGTEFLVVWQDEREGIFNLFGQRVGVNGAPIGSNIKLTTNDLGLGNEAPSMAAGQKSVGVAWNVGDALSHLVQFQIFGVDLTKPISPPLSLTSGSSDAVYPTVVWNKDRYVIAWYDRTASPKAIYAAAVGEDGSILVPPKPITNPGVFRSRYPHLKPLGDRLLLVYADDRDQNDGYEIYARMITSELGGLGPEQRVTNAPRDSIYPVADCGPDGDVGILFRDDREGGKHHVWFTRLGCVATTP